MLMVLDFFLYTLCHISLRGIGGNMWEMERDWGKGMGKIGKGEETGYKQIGHQRKILEN